jgi:choline kinase
MPPSDPDLPLLPSQYPPTLLLRIYGPSSDALISRTEELRILHVLSTQYGLGPRVFGTFANGRVEQFFPSRALTSVEMRDKLVSRGIARRMRELHSVDMLALGYQAEDLEVPTVWKSINEWIPAAKEVLTTLGAHGGRWEMWVEKAALHRLPEEIEVYKRWMMEQEPSRLVFARESLIYIHNRGCLDDEAKK